MKEYIERASVHKLVKSLSKYQMFSYDRTESLIGINPDDVDFWVDKILAADVAEVRHGYWEEANDGDGAVCSECGTDFCTITNEVERFNYCPACGCRMNKEV